MSDFMDAYHQQVQAALKCPRCGAANRPRATYVDLNPTRTHAFCNICAKSGPIEDFQQEK